MKHRLLVALLLALAGCATEPLPDFRYYRLPPPAKVEALARPLLEQPLVVEGFRADGALGERPILYSLDPSAIRLAQYNYQLWVEPPPLLVQRRLVAQLRARAVAPLVTDRLSPRARAYRLQGRVERFERLRGADATRIAVALVLRLEQDGAPRPRLERRYEEVLEVGGAELKDSVEAMASALDSIVERWLRDLAASPNS